MAEVDIDKILEQNEKKEKDAKKKKTIIFAAIGVIVAALTAAVAIIAVTATTGKDSSGYMPLESAQKLLYNRVGGASEKWQVMEKSETVDGIECRVMNAIDQSNFFSYQSYFYFSEIGLVLYAVSQNFGEKTRVQLVVLPAKIKKSGTYQAGGQVTGAYSHEELACPLGLLQTVRVDLTGGGVDRSFWFAEGTGIVKYVDRAKNEEVNIISVEK